MLSLNQKIGIGLRYIREAKNLKLKYVAEYAGYEDSSTYSRVESGKIDYLDLRKLERICALFGCELVHILLMTEMQNFNYRIKTWEEFLESLRYLPEQDKTNMLALANRVLKSTSK
jgi:transcriptional regulator with XRE-family HTH domain